ncbi:hypothetical protein Pcinc_042279 [Petrolisthes cinctipes]|uniref:Deoxyhypusine synthase n=1 Tax=Petrolisthes cinctipes TaxID=88211 RepID=A0AAE1EHI7_PETCI|nr:hypothetical protein Pcinc_042279 [Petrolisthes cinctipes]
MEREKDIAKEAVLVRSQEMPQGTPIVKGYDFNTGLDYHSLLQSFRYSGFQATSFGCAVEEINKMLAKREEPLPSNFSDDLEEDEFIKIVNNCTVFLGYTSNMASCGVRETIRYLVEHRLVDALVTTAGGVEEDLIKCLAPTYLGDWHLPDWVMPRLDKMLEEQRTQGVVWSPSTMIARLGSEVNDPSSIAYWASKNKIPMFSPALTDGSLGDMMYFHGIKSPGLVLDINSGRCVCVCV